MYRALFSVLLGIALLLRCPGQPQSEISIEEAYQAYVKSPTFPHPESESDTKWIRVLQKRPNETARYLLPLMSRGQPPSIVHQAKAVLNVLPSEIAFPTAHEAEKTYPLGNRDFPIFGIFIEFGDLSDMDRLKQEVALAPDSKLAKEIGTEMALSTNPPARQAALQLARSAPGKWMDDADVARFFKKNGVVREKIQAPDLGSSSNFPAAGVSTAKADVPKTPEIIDPSLTPHGHTWWKWGMGGAILVAVYVVVRRNSN